MEDTLLQVMRPARYIGGEWNSSRKDFSKADVKFALCFPDLYEIGMSNLGMRILYGLLNNMDAVCCERFFSPDSDMEALLRADGPGILSLESKQRLRDFDFVGLSLPHELNYTNILTLLDLGKIPLKASERDNSYPLVIGGGPCVLNPEPLHAFFDLFVIGEGEEIIHEIIKMYRENREQFRKGELKRQDLLVKFSSIEGIYVPSLYDVLYDDAGGLQSFKPKMPGVPNSIKKRFVKDFDKSFFPVDWLVPYIQIVHDRVTLEIMRGCPNTCRFCQSRSQYYPFRQRSVKTVLALAEKAYACTGYEEVSLTGLSVSDYKEIEELLTKMTEIFYTRKVSMSLPSIKPKSYVGKLSEIISSIKKTGLTFAPEAGSERLRRMLGKDFDTQIFNEALTRAYAAGYQHVKLYFLMGISTEDDADLDKIVEFAVGVSRMRKAPGVGPANVNISVNTLIPKPHTPFQWLGMLNLEEISRKQEYLRNKIKNRRLKLNFHNRYMSVVEGIFSRGDRKLSEVILNAFNKGARFDAWGNRFNFSIWEAAFHECGINPDSYLKERPRESVLPWSFIDIGITQDTLLAEFNKLLQ